MSAISIKCGLPPGLAAAVGAVPGGSRRPESAAAAAVAAAAAAAAAARTPRIHTSYPPHSSPRPAGGGILSGSERICACGDAALALLGPGGSPPVARRT